jgi:hypothetical protein
VEVSGNRTVGELVAHHCEGIAHGGREAAEFFGRIPVIVEVEGHSAILGRTM